MSWEAELVKFYKSKEKHAGDYKYAEKKGQTVMTPIFSKAIRAQYEIAITASGELEHVKMLEKKDKTAIIMIPFTAENQSRTSDAYNHPALFVDQIRFLAKDPEGIKKTEKKGELVGVAPVFHENYMAGLTAWAKSKYSHPYLHALIAYLEKGTIVKDIIAVSGKEIDQQSMPRFVIDEKETWKDMSFHRLFQEYYISSAPDSVPCPITGVVQPPMGRKASKISGNSKFFSCNDDKNFTFRGDRYADKETLPMMGAATEQSITSAYKWLVSNQSSNGYVYWGIKDMASPWADSKTICQKFGRDNNTQEQDKQSYEDAIQKEKNWAKQFKSYLSGYSETIPPTTDVCIMRAEVSTKGRISIAAYYQYSVDDFFRIIRNWHVRGAWKQAYYRGVPAPGALISAALSKNPAIGESDACSKLMTQQLIQCMLHDRQVPISLVRMASSNLAKKAAAVPHKEDKQDRRVESMRGWENYMLRPLCSLIASYYNYSIKEEENYYTMALDRSNTNRSYLFGRLLACAHKIELNDDSQKSTDSSRKHKTTNALKLATRFEKYPASTWAILMNKLNPYLIRAEYQGPQIQIKEILNLFDFDDFNSSKPLDPVFWLGYSSQLNDFYISKKNTNATNDDAQAKD